MLKRKVKTLTDKISTIDGLFIPPGMGKTQKAIELTLENVKKNKSPNTDSLISEPMNPLSIPNPANNAVQITRLKFADCLVC